MINQIVQQNNETCLTLRNSGDLLIPNTKFLFTTDDYSMTLLVENATQNMKVTMVQDEREALQLLKENSLTKALSKEEAEQQRIFSSTTLNMERVKQLSICVSEVEIVEYTIKVIENFYYLFCGRKEKKACERLFDIIEILSSKYTPVYSLSKMLDMRNEDFASLMNAQDVILKFEQLTKEEDFYDD